MGNSKTHYFQRQTLQLTKSSVLFIFTLLYSLCLQVSCVVPISIYEKPERPRLLVSDGVPFVPEEFRDYNNIIFNRIDFQEISLAAPEKTVGLEVLLLQMIKNETEVDAETPPDEIFVQTTVKYVGRGMWTNNGRNARLAVTLEGLVCGNKVENPKCHTKRCHLELNETFLPPPWPLGEDVDSRRQNLSILRWSCARKERWCYACRDSISLSSMLHPNGNDDLEHQSSWPVCHMENPEDADDSLFKLNCNRQYGDLDLGKRYACSVSFSQVSGVATEIQSRSCTVVDALETSEEIGLCQTDTIDYKSKCTCHKSGCNGNIFVRKKVSTSFSPQYDSPTKDIQNSIRQLRADVQRMISRINHCDQTNEQNQPIDTSFIEQ